MELFCSMRNIILEWNAVHDGGNIICESNRTSLFLLCGVSAFQSKVVILGGKKSVSLDPFLGIEIQQNCKKRKLD